MADLPYVPSELLEPHMVATFGIFTRDLASYADAPPVEFFKEWALRFQGIDYLIRGMHSPHAQMAWSNLTGRIGVASECSSYVQPVDAATMRRILWECACEAVRS